MLLALQISTVVYARATKQIKKAPAKAKSQFKGAAKKVASKAKGSVSNKPSGAQFWWVWDRSFSHELNYCKHCAASLQGQR